ncbi:hypothetical protein FRX31_025554 [Thalictrum thalictroides]|uniref:Uncharacterized protein n=1 Tax=Thalictrum thalictroides TaxID=46969 RepID=A0A7J6VIB3_THATH|nr:hypothetical protein FRX31_025554 [Thalictrum thalictroides]
MVTDESVNSYIMDETLSSMEKFLGLIDTMESIANKQQKAEFFFDNVDELRKMIAELEKVGYNVGSFKKWFDGLELSLLLLRENDGKLSVLDKERKELEEEKFEAFPIQSTEERLQTNEREMVADESANNYVIVRETQSYVEKFLRLTDILESIKNDQQKVDFFFSNVDELRRIIAELEKLGCNVVTSKKWVDEMESSMLLLRDKKETEEELACVENRLAEINLNLAEEGELLAELNRMLAEISLCSFFCYVLLFVWCVVGCILVKYLIEII